MTPYDIIFDYYKKGSRAADVLIRHSELVQGKALSLAEKVPHLKPNKSLIAEAAMLHDVGIYQTNSPQLGCYGRHPYIYHGVIGRQILDQRGMHAHALVCERHVGAGITTADIETQKLPLPKRDMLPISIEEIIVCYADKFFSKSKGRQCHPLDKVVDELARYGNDNVHRFMAWHNLLTDSS